MKAKKKRDLHGGNWRKLNTTKKKVLRAKVEKLNLRELVSS